MRNIEELINYTTKKKSEQLKKLDHFYEEPLLELNAYLQDRESPAVIGLSYSFLSSWFMFSYQQEFFLRKTLNDSYLCLSTLYGIESNNIRFLLGKKVERFKSALEFQTSIKHMSQALILGWDELAISYGHLLIKMLYGKQYTGGHSGYKHPWFMLVIFCKWQKITLDFKELRYPEDMSVYQRAIDSWNTNNLSELTNIIDELCEYHIDESDEDEYEDKIPDFSSSDYFVYAIEILLWLNIRHRLGLVEYIPSNDLMRQSINKWKMKKVDIPYIEVVKQIKQKLKEENPTLDFEI